MKSFALFVAMVFVIALIMVSAQKAEFKQEKFEVYASSHPEENLLPTFMFAQGSVEGGGSAVVLNSQGGRGAIKPSSFDDNVDLELLDGLMTDVRSPVLPFLLQSHWDCEAVQHDYENGLVLENDKIKVMINPNQNGKIWQMYDKVNKRDMVQAKIGPDNKLNYANIGVHKMWSSGGAEWNHSPGIIGHSAFAERPTHAAKLETEKGPVIRVWEFDRYNYTTFQVDIFLQDDIVWVHPSVHNPNDYICPGYWWTCVAHTANSDDRIIAPADRVAETEAGPTRLAPWPYLAPVQNSSFAGKDDSWLIDHSWQLNSVWGDWFLRIPRENEKWIQHTKGDGYSVFHAPGIENEGVKFFTWGNNGPSRFMQDFLAHFPENRAGDYVELQTGRKPTQSQQYFMEPGSNTEWTESFKAWMPNAEQNAALHDKDYSKAVGVTSAWWKSENGIPQKLNDEIDAWMKTLARREIDPTKDTILNNSSDWGALHNKLRKKLGKSELPKTTYFAYKDGKPSAAARPWDELLSEAGTFSAQTLREIPESFQITEDWLNILKQSVLDTGATWLHLFHMAVIHMERGAVDEPRNLLRQSLGLKETPHAYRCLALLESNEKDALAYLLKAWDTALKIPADRINRDRLIYYLGSEIAQFMQVQGLAGKQYFRDTLKWFIEQQITLENVPKSLATVDPVISGQVAVYLWNHKPEQALAILNDEKQNCFPTYGRQRSELINYWNDAHIMIESDKQKRPLSIKEQHAVKLANPQNRRIGCPYSTWYCTQYW